MTAERLVVSVHDIAPSTQAEVRWLLAALDRLGIAPRVLKVVPNEAGSGDLRAHPDLCALLRDEAANGSEIVLHGFTHRPAGRLRGAWPDRLRARLFAANAAEFLGLDRPEMASRLREGRAILGEVGLVAHGFCAPGWLAVPELPDLLRELDFDYVVSMTVLHDVNRGRRRHLLPVGYMGAGPVQEPLVGIGMGLALTAAPFAPVIKVFLHPQRAPDSTACARALVILERLRRRRRPMTYGQLLAA